MYEMNELNRIVLYSLPHWAMLIDVKNRTVLAANKLALEGGGDYLSMLGRPRAPLVHLEGA